MKNSNLPNFKSSPRAQKSKDNISKNHNNNNKSTRTQVPEKGTANFEHFENENVFPKQAGTIKCFVRSWVNLTSKKEVLETVTGMPINSNYLSPGNMAQNLLGKRGKSEMKYNSSLRFWCQQNDIFSRFFPGRYMKRANCKFLPVKL